MDLWVNHACWLDGAGGVVVAIVAVEGMLVVPNRTFCVGVLLLKLEKGWRVVMLACRVPFLEI